MGRSRGNVLRAVHAALEASTDLVQLLRHTAGAVSIARGARIVGDSVQLEELKLPMLILGFEGGQSIQPARENLAMWNVNVTIYAEDVFQAADVLDEVELACANYRANQINTAIKLARLRCLSHQRLQLEDQQVIAVLVNLEAAWVQA